MGMPEWILIPGAVIFVMLASVFLYEWRDKRRHRKWQDEWNEKQRLKNEDH
jgi:hypothetical protein